MLYHVNFEAENVPFWRKIMKQCVTNTPLQDLGPWIPSLLAIKLLLISSKEVSNEEWGKLRGLFLIDYDWFFPGQNHKKVLFSFVYFHDHKVQRFRKYFFHWFGNEIGLFSWVRFFLQFHLEWKFDFFFIISTDLIILWWCKNETLLKRIFLKFVGMPNLLKII